MPALMPKDPLEAGKVMKLICHMKLDVELADQPNIRSVMALMAEHPSIKRVEAEKSA
jgi:hypothetical protein